MAISKCCLFIDNDPSHQVVFASALKDVSPETICFIVPDGIDALYMMLRENVIPGYIFIELQLPHMGGLEFLRAVRQMELFREIPVIVHSTSPQPHLIIELKELGATAIYFRPYDYQGVCNMLALYYANDASRILPN